MTIKRLILVALTAFALFLMGTDLISSFNKPQFQTRLALFEADLKLHIAEFQPAGNSADALSTTFQDLVAEQRSPLQPALAQYEEARQIAAQSLESSRQSLAKLETAWQSQHPPSEPEKQQLNQQTQLVATQQTTLEEITIRQGILKVRIEQDPQSALEIWQGLDEPLTPQTAELLPVLQGLWSDPIQLQPEAEAIVKRSLDGWYRYQALKRLYEAEQRSEAIATLQAQEQQKAAEVMTKVGFSGLLSFAAIVTGSLSLLGLLVQWGLKRKESAIGSLSTIRWTVPWDWESVWLVLAVGFFFCGQILIGALIAPLLVEFLGSVGISGALAQGIQAIGVYSCLAIAGLTTLYLVLKPHRPLPQDWFQVKWQGRGFLWGVGGYLMAFPLVILVSLLNQQIWQGQGGSNPLLPIALQSQDNTAKILFFVTAAVFAPIFEEILFRGFLLPSLTRYVSNWNAILLSSFLFALVHLSLSEVLPLTVLGIVLAFVYTRTQNLLAPILLHSLWNGGTLISLFLLGSAAR
ncbi:MAG: type II CAAX endopeptidase family protein [Synechococcales bacterium]|nr:type II CAAX endopeptidase family protein [Synechococcales bacterium]